LKTIGSYGRTLAIFRRRDFPPSRRPFYLELPHKITKLSAIAAVIFGLASLSLSGCLPQADSFELPHAESSEELGHHAHLIVVTSPIRKEVISTQPYVSQIHSCQHIQVRALERGANARQLQAAYDDQRTVLNAFTEVVNSTNKVQNYRRSIDIKQDQVQALEQSVHVARDLFNAPILEEFDRVE